MQSTRERYIAPKLVSYTEDEILDLLGPARTYGGSVEEAPLDPSAPAGGSSTGKGRAKKR